MLKTGTVWHSDIRWVSRRGVAVPLVFSAVVLAGVGWSGCSDSPSTNDATDTDTSGDTGDTGPTQDTAPETAQDIAPMDAETSLDTAPDGDGEVSVTCQALNVSGSLVANDVSGVFTLGGEIDLGLGGALPDVIVFEFYTEGTGTFPLGTGNNANYKDCDQCIRILEDVDLGSGKQPRQYFASGGSITIENTAATGRDVRLTLENVEFVEVTIRSADFQSTPVVNGLCYERESALVLETATCVPECGDRICGDDGCGGACGAGCEGTTVCSLDGLRCETSPTICQKAELSGVLSNPDAGVYRLPLTQLGLGAINGNDFMQIEFYSGGTGGFSLGGGINRNYRTCDQCVRVVIDGRREFFQREGLLVVEDVSDPIATPGVDAFVRLAFDKVRLEEVTLDDEFNSTPIPNGPCIDLVIDGVLSSAEL